MGDLADLFSEREIKMGETRDETEEPLIEDGEWGKIKNYNAIDLETWDQRDELPAGRKWKNADLALS